MTFRILLPLLICVGAVNAQITSILNGASFKTEIAAGSWGLSLGTFAGVTATTGTTPVTTSLGGATVSVAGVAAPVYYVSASQIDFIVPQSVTAGVQSIQMKAGANTYDSSIRCCSAPSNTRIRTS
jgi:uncharacterized protein (TIGR03437 family)